MDMEGSFLVPWQLKAADDKGVLMGIANVMDYIDFGGDKVMPGAFNKTLKDHDGIFPLEMDHGKGLSEEIGVAYLAIRGDALVLERGELNMSSARVRDEVYPLLKFRMEKGLPAGLSINYRIPKGGAKFNNSGVRELTEIALRKIGVVDEPMNDRAMITDVKGATSYGNLPISDKGFRFWDAEAADKRVRVWAGGDNLTPSKYRQAFFWYDAEKPEIVGSYKLPFADIIDGTLTAIPRGIFAAAGAVQGARGGVKIPDADMPAVKAHIGKYYKKMDKSAPWEPKSDGAAAFYKSMAMEAGMEEPTGFVPDFASEMADMNEELMHMRRGMIDSALCSVLWSLLDNADLAPADKTAQATDAIAAHGDEMKGWFAEAIARDNETMKAARDEVEVKAGRVLSKKNETALREAHAMHMEAGKKIDGVLSQLGSAKSITALADEPGQNRSHSDQAAGNDGAKDMSGLAASLLRRNIDILRKP